MTQTMTKQKKYRHISMQLPVQLDFTLFDDYNMIDTQK
jgi:hypothetical protein